MRKTIFVAFLLIAAAARADDKKELQDVELAVEKARYAIPSEGYAKFEEYLRERAAKVPVTIAIAEGPRTRVPLADGTPSPVELRAMDVSGRGDPRDAQVFLARVTGLLQLALLDSMDFRAQPEGDVAWRARLAMAVWINDSPKIDLSGGPDAAIHRLLLLRKAQLAAMTSLQERVAERRRVLGAIATFQHEAFQRAIALHEIKVDGETRIDGVLLGTAAREALRPALKTGGFSVLRVDFTPRGDCQAFAVAAQTTPNVPEGAEWGASNVFYADAAPACTPKRPAAIAHAAARGGGNVTMHFRGIEAADLFQALGMATNEGFIVDSDVKGRFDVDFDHVTPAAALAALQSAGIAAGPGPLHLVGTTAAVPAGNYNGEPISIAVHDADVRDILQVLTQVSGGKSLPAPPAPRYLSIFAPEEPWDRLHAGIQAMLSAKKGGTAVSEPGPAWWTLLAENLFVRDLTLAGVAETADGWVGFAYGPGARRRAIVLDAKTKLRDAAVKAVDASGVTFDDGKTIIAPASPPPAPGFSGLGWALHQLEMLLACVSANAATSTK